MAKNKKPIDVEIRDFLNDTIDAQHASILEDGSDEPELDLAIVYHLEDIYITASQIKNDSDRERMLKVFAQLFEGEPGYKEEWRP